MEFVETVRPAIHIVLHLVIPLLVAWLFGGRDKRRAFVWMLAAMVIDLDHLVAVPIYAAGRCSIGFHPLHQWPAALVYVGMSTLRPTRWFGLGALLHLGLDALDCVMMSASNA